VLNGTRGGRGKEYQGDAMKIICKVCGKLESEHHEFEPAMVDKDCKCDPSGWGAFVKEICGKFTLDEEMLETYGERRCLNCEHGEECHTKKGSDE